MKDRDLMRDTGGSGRKRDLQKPSRSQGKGRARKRALSRDPDFSDTMRDPDLRLGSEEDIALMLVDLATQIMDEEEEPGEVYL